MTSYLRRLLTTGAAYQVAEIVSKLIALALLPVYTRHLTPADYGTAELLITLVILASIVVRLGIGEALVRFHFHDADPDRQRQLARTATALLALTTTVAAVALALLAGPVSELILGAHRPAEVRAAALGLWAFTNLELAYALLRVKEASRAYLLTSLSNVAMTVALTLWLVVALDQGAFGLILGNYAASCLALVGLWWAQRDLIGFRRGALRGDLLRPMLRFGLPTVPAEASVFALFVIDRFYLYRVDSEEAAGLYSLSIKLAAIVVFTVRAFQYAWPPLAYSISDDNEAGRVYARVATWYVIFTALVVSVLALLGRWLVRGFAAPEFYAAHEALPWVALGWALYGLYLMLVSMAGRAHVTVRSVPPALAGLGVNVLLLVLLVEPLGIAGAALALVGAYVVMLVALWALTRKVFVVPFEWRRMEVVVVVAGGVTAAGEWLLPTAGWDGFLLRLGVVLALPVVLWVARCFAPGELAAGRRLIGSLRRRGRGDGVRDVASTDPGEDIASPLS